jgi:putative transposase
MRYRRADAAGGTYFFTANLAEWRSDLLVRHIDDLRVTMKTVKDSNPLRWSLIKDGFSRRLAKGERIRASRQDKRERGIWQRRY